MSRGESLSRFMAAFVAGLTVFTHPVASQQQPLKAGVPGTFEVVGNSGVSAQQLFLGNLNKVYILDKTEANPLNVSGHAAWAVEYDINTNQYRAMDVMSNTLCAAGNVLGDGEWILAGGNLAVSPDGWWSPVQEAPGDPIYHDTDGGKAMRFITPCEDQKCEWIDDPKRYMSTRRWYATIEKLEGGDVFFVGGTTLGSFVNNNATADNPTYEFYPPRGNGQPIDMQFMKDTAPLNLYALTYLLPSGKLFLQANRAAMLFDYTTGKEDRLPSVPGAARTYPATAASVMMPLTPANNYAATILICGGSDIEDNQWDTNWNIAQYPASASCVSMTPDASRTWQIEERLPIGRTMGNFIMLPDQTLFLSNGGATGVAGYAGDSWAVDDSYADHPVLMPSIYNPRAPMGKRFSSEGFSASVVPRLYHSTATLLPDGSVFIAGSNPNSDFRNDPKMKYPTEYRTERFYPSYFNATRPEPKGLPANLTYGGPYFNVTLDAAHAGPSDGFEDITVVVLRPGFATHALNMGQRLLQLQSTYAPNGDGSVTLHVSQMPPNAALFQPGPALLFVVVGGVPSMGVQVMVGSGKIETQTMNAFVNLPPSPPSTKNANTTSGALSNAQVGTYLPLVMGIVTAVLSLW